MWLWGGGSCLGLGEGSKPSRVSFSFVNPCLSSLHSSASNGELEDMGEIGVGKVLGEEP